MVILPVSESNETTIRLSSYNEISYMMRGSERRARATRNNEHVRYEAEDRESRIQDGNYHLRAQGELVCESGRRREDHKKIYRR